MRGCTNILVAGDNAADRDLCRESLEAEEYEITEAAGGPASLAAVQERRPDLIVMDGTTPNARALECTRRLKADPATRDIPIIMLTFEEEEIAAGLEAGADDYIVKPFDCRELVLRMRSLPDLCRQKLELLRNRDVLGEHARVMTVLLEFAQRLAVANKLDTVLDETVSMTMQLTGCRRVSIMLPDPEEKCLTIAKSVGIDEELAARIRVPVGSATAGRVFLSGNPLVVNTPGQHRNRGYDSEFFVSAPMMSKALSAPEHVVGVLNITERHDGHPFMPLELEHIDLICSIAAYVIDDLITRFARDQARDSIAVALAKLAEYRDSDTGLHLDRVSGFAMILAEDLRKTERFRTKIDDRFISELKRAVPLHDIGKVATPDHILLKPGKLTAEEMTIMRKHPEVGAETIRALVKRTPGTHFLKMAQKIAYAHHEWYDGSGYPRGTRGEEIPLAARIAALADVYDALTTKRPYKDAMPHEKAVEIIRELSGSQFDPAIVKAFVNHEQAFADVATRLADQGTTPTGLEEGQLGSAQLVASS